MAPSPRYRIEHHTNEARRVVDYLDSGPPHHRTLDPYAGRLILEGQDGWVALVDQSTDTVVARRHLRPASGRTWARQKDGE